MHAAWARWAEAAEALFERVRPLLAARRHVAGPNDLDYAIGRARAMLQITPEDHIAAGEQVRRGEVVSGEEVRVSYTLAFSSAARERGPAARAGARSEARFTGFGDAAAGCQERSVL